MSHRVITVLLLVLVCAPACKSKSATPQKRGASQKWKDQAAPKHTPFFDKETPQEVIDEFNAQFLIEPDRRITAAIPEIDAMFTGDEPGQLALDPDQGGWSVSYRDRPIGTVEELAGFEDLYELVRLHAYDIVQELDVEDGEESGDDPGLGVDAVEALLACEKEWKDKPTKALVTSGARALVALQASLFDPMGMSDRVATKAIAMLAMAEEMGTDMSRERAILARKMGYETSATEMSRSLPEDDPVRAYASCALDELRALARSSRSDPLVQLMFISSLSDFGHFDEVAGEIDALPKSTSRTLPFLALDLWADRELERADTLLTHTLIDLRSLMGEHPVEPELKSMLTGESWTLLPKIEEDLKLLEKLEGPFLDTTTAQAYFGANTIAAVDAIARHRLDKLGSTKAASWFVKDLGKPKSTLGNDYLRYYMDRISADERTIGFDTLIADINEIKSFGTMAKYDLYENVEDRGMTDQKAQVAARAFMKAADSRPHDRNILVSVTWGGLLDAALSEKLARSTAAEAPSTNWGRAVRVAALDGDVDGILQLLDDPRLSPNARTTALFYLQDKKLIEEERLREEYAKVISTSGAAWGPMSQYYDHLEDQKDWEAAYHVANDWLQLKDHEKGIPEHRAMTMAAEMLYRLDRHDDAWKIVEPLMPGIQDAFTTGSRIRSAQGNHEEAEAIARFCMQRYVNTASILQLARVYWEAEQYGKAARLLAEPPRQLTSADWRWKAGGVFADVFGDDPGKGAKAFEYLLDTAIDKQMLREMAIEVGRLEHLELEFEMLSRVKIGGYAQLLVDGNAYTTLKQLEGKDEAMRWIKERYSSGVHDAVSQYGYEAEAYELPWELVPDPPPDQEGADWTWIMKTVSYLDEGSQNPDWKKRLDANYSREPKIFGDVLGRFLLGQGSEQDVWKAREEPRHSTVATYFMGYRAERDGDHARAIAWYRITIESCKWNASEGRWAFQRLWDLRDSGLSVARMGKQPE